MQVGIIYLGDSYREEEMFAKTKSINTMRFLTENDIEGDNNLYDCAFFIRGKKIKDLEYTDIWKNFNDKGFNLITKPESFDIIVDAVKSSNIFGAYAPRTASFGINTDVSVILSSLKRDKFCAPIFIRSEIESVAKYAGINNCILNHFAADGLENCLSHLRNHVKGYKYIILKEIIEIAENDLGNKQEIRAVVFKDKILIFDGVILDKDFEDYLPTMKNAINSFYAKGLDGVYFIDFAVKKTGGLFVVECKDISHGTIKNTEAFINAVADVNNKKHIFGNM